MEFAKSYTVNQSIGGSGVVKVSSGTLELTTANSYSGGTIIASGATLKVSSDGALGSGGVNNSYDVNGGTLEFSFDDDLTHTFTNAIGHSTHITNIKISNGTVELKDYDSCGTITIAKGATLNYTTDATYFKSSYVCCDGLITYSKKLGLYNLSGAGTVYSRSGQELGLYNSGSWYGNIDTNGSVCKANNGTFTFYTENTYTGQTIIGGGDIALAHENAIQSSGQITFRASKSSLRITAGDQILQNLTSQYFASYQREGHVVTLAGAKLTLKNTYSTDFYGDISEGGNIDKTGSGTLTFHKAHTYTGSTTVSEGTLKLSAENAITTSSSVTNNATITLTEAQIFKNLQGSKSTAEIQTGGKLLTVTADDGTDTAVEYTYAGKITGDGGLTKNGADTLTLSNSGNTYTGATTVSVGTLKLSAKDAIAQSTSVSVADGAKIDMQANQTLNSLSSTDTTTSTAEVKMNGYNLTLSVADSATSTYAGTITGKGNIVKIDGGTQVLASLPTNNKIYAKDGTLEIQGAVNNSSVQIDNGATVKLDAVSTLGSLNSTAKVTQAEPEEQAKLLADNKITITEASEFYGAIQASGQTVEFNAPNKLIKLYSPKQADASIGNFALASGNLHMKGFYEGSMEITGGTFSPGNSIGDVVFAKDADTGGNFSVNGGTVIFEVSGFLNDWDTITAESFAMTGSSSFIHIDASPIIMEGQEFAIVDAKSISMGGTDSASLEKWLDDSSKDMWDLEVRDGGTKCKQLWLIAKDSLVPEPSTWALLILGCTGLLWLRKRNEKR